MGKFHTRKIAVKNIKVERRQTNDAEAISRFFEQQQAVLLDATTAIALLGSPPTVSEEELYRIVETFCRHGKGAQCWQSLYSEALEPLTSKCLAKIEAISDAGLKSVTAAFLDEYDLWRERVLKLQHIYFYLDRSFLLQNANGGSDMVRRAQDLLRDAIYGSIGAKVEADFAAEYARMLRGESETAFWLLKRCEGVVRELTGESSAHYQRLIEQIHKQTQRHFKSQAEKWQILAPRDYLKLVVDVHVAENRRLSELIDDAALVKAVMNSLPDEMITPHMAFLQRGISESFEDESMFPCVQALSLMDFEDVGGQLRLGGIFRKWIESMGQSFEHIDHAISAYTKSRRVVVFLGLELISKSSDWMAGFRSSMRGKRNLSEQLAKYSDTLLRKGAKGDTLSSDDVAILTFLLSCIPEKDVFEVYYKRYLSKRLLVGRSLGLEGEKELLTVLKDEFGPELTESMETMLKDVRTTSLATMSQYRESSDYTKCGNFELNVNLLSQNAWPQFPAAASTIRLPSQMYNQLDNFSKFLSQDPKSAKKKITWQHALSTCTVRAHLNDDTKDFDVSLHQALVMLQFVDEKKRPSMTFKELQAATGLAERELTMSLYSLMTPKLRLVYKEPAGKELVEGDQFKFNWNFTSKLRRVKVPPASRSDDMMLPHKKIQEDVARDRNMEIQAVIIRIMKARRSLKHRELVAEVLDKTKSRGILEVSVVKQNISKMIADDFISREGQDVYNYVA